MWIDIGVIVFLILLMIRGYNIGFGKSFANLVSWVAAIIVAYYFSSGLKEYFLNTSFIGGWFQSLSYEHLPKALANQMSSGIAEICAAVVAFILIIIIVKIILKIVFSMFKFVKRLPGIGKLNKILGGIMGLAKGVIILWILALFTIPLVAVFNSTGMTGVFEDSHIVTALYEYNSLFKLF